MKKRNMLWVGLLLLLSLTGCTREDPYKVDTVIQIPVDPTAPVTAPTLASTAPVTEATEGAEPEPTKAAKPSSGKPNASKPSSGKNNTKPAATQPPAAEPEPTVEVVWTEVPTEPPYDPFTYVPESLDYELLELVNARRTEAGAGELTMDTQLCGLAALRARELSLVWSHTRPDGRNWDTVLSDYGFSYAVQDENLIYVDVRPEAEALVSGWMGSPSHAASLCNPACSWAGIGVFAENGYTYVVFLVAG